MTTKETVMKEIEKIPDTEPFLKLILDMLEAYKVAPKKTKNVRPIRTQKNMANIDCQYPKSNRRKKGVITDEDIEKIRKKLKAPLFGKDFKPLRREELYDR